jgi:hypothetical protein
MIYQVEAESQFFDPNATGPGLKFLDQSSLPRQLGHSLSVRGTTTGCTRLPDGQYRDRASPQGFGK